MGATLVLVDGVHASLAGANHQSKERVSVASIHSCPKTGTDDQALSVSFIWSVADAHMNYILTMVFGCGIIDV